MEKYIDYLLTCTDFIIEFVAYCQKSKVKVYNATNRKYSWWRKCDSIQLFVVKQLRIEYNPIFNCLYVIGLTDDDFSILKRHYLNVFNILKVKKLRHRFHGR